MKNERDELAHRLSGRDDFEMIDVTDAELAEMKERDPRQAGLEVRLRETNTIPGSGNEVRSHMHKSVNNLDANLPQANADENET